jgi:ParB-like chromosome segregation protein Spo0J
MANWRDLMPVHPAADIFPLLDDADLVALGNDIKKNGLVSPIAVDFDLSKNSKPILVDGRNRLAAMERVGIRVRLEEIHARRGGEVIGHRLAADDIDLNITEEETTISVIRGDPTEYIISANIHRRHLTLLQKKELTAALLKDNPGRSNRATGDIVKLDDKTVASVRREMESRAEIPHVDRVVDTKGREQPVSRPKASAIPAREPTQQQRDIGARNAKIIASVTGQSLGDVAESVATAPTTADPCEIAALANAVRVGLSGLDPILDRIAQVGADVFWRQAGDSVRRQVESTAEFLQTLTATAPAEVA